MAFELLWTDHADVVGTYDSRSEAEADLLAYAAANPKQADGIALLEIDDQGRGIGDFVSGAELLKQQRRTAARSGASARIARARSRTKVGAMPKNERHVVPNPAGGWDVKKPGADRASSHHDTQRDAEARAKEILGNSGGGEAVIHGRDGGIRDKDTVAPGNDPFPPRDRKH